MTLISVLAMAGGLVILGYLPLPKNKVQARVSQGAGGVLFVAGLAGLMWAIVPAGV